MTIKNGTEILSCAPRACSDGEVIRSGRGEEEKRTRKHPTPRAHSRSGYQQRFSSFGELVQWSMAPDVLVVLEFRPALAISAAPPTGNFQRLYHNQKQNPRLVQFKYMLPLLNSCRNPLGHNLRLESLTYTSFPVCTYSSIRCDRGFSKTKRVDASSLAEHMKYSIMDI